MNERERDLCDTETMTASTYRKRGVAETAAGRRKFTRGPTKRKGGGEHSQPVLVSSSCSYSFSFHISQGHDGELKTENDRLNQLVEELQSALGEVPTLLAFFYLARWTWYRSSKCHVLGCRRGNEARQPGCRLNQRWKRSERKSGLRHLLRSKA